MNIRGSYRPISTVVSAIMLGSLPAASHALVVSITDFTVHRNGALFFTDPFSDGSEPPSAPNFPSGAPASYLVLGTIPGTAESGGLLQIDSANGAISANALELARRETRVRLATNIDPTNLTAGLKSGHTMSLSGIFGLTIPAGVFNPQYSVRFVDTDATGATQIAQMQVVFNTAIGQAQIRYILQDFVADTITVLGADPLAPPSGADEILLGIDRPSAASDDFFGSYAYVSGGVVGPLVQFTLPAQMFQNRNFVRADFNVSDGFIAAVPEPATLALLGLGFAGLAALRRTRS